MADGVSALIQLLGNVSALRADASPLPVTQDRTLTRVKEAEDAAHRRARDRRVGVRG